MACVWLFLELFEQFAGFVGCLGPGVLLDDLLVVQLGLVHLACLRQLLGQLQLARCILFGLLGILYRILLGGCFLATGRFLLGGGLVAGFVFLLGGALLGGYCGFLAGR